MSLEDESIYLKRTAFSILAVENIKVGYLKKKKQQQHRNPRTQNLHNELNLDIAS